MTNNRKLPGRSPVRENFARELNSFKVRNLLCMRRKLRRPLRRTDTRSLAWCVAMLRVVGIKLPAIFMRARWANGCADSLSTWMAEFQPEDIQPTTFTAGALGTIAGQLLAKEATRGLVKGVAKAIFTGLFSAWSESTADLAAPKVTIEAQDEGGDIE